MSRYGDEYAADAFNVVAGDSTSPSMSLRCDLTVPLARQLAATPSYAHRRAHIGRVYRHENVISRVGRKREFEQADFDIIGQAAPGLAEAECLRIVKEVLDDLRVDGYKVKVNHRGILESACRAVGVHDAERIAAVCRSIDKLDKKTFAVVARELIEEPTRKLDVQQVDKLSELLSLDSAEPRDDVSFSQQLAEVQERFGNVPNAESASQAFSELAAMSKLADQLGVQTERVTFTPTLARGLDYYTGAIYEVLSHPDTTGLGAIAGGGRYDRLVSRLNPSASDVPCAGVSFGVDRLLHLLLPQSANEPTPRPNATAVWVTAPQRGLLEERLSVCRTLWNARIPAETNMKSNAKFLSVVQTCEAAGVPLMVVIGREEISNKQVRLRVVATREERLVSVDNIVEAIKQLLPEGSFDEQDELCY